IWARASRHLERPRRNNHDMDIVNAEFGAEIQSLPAETFCLNSEWEVPNRSQHFTECIADPSSVSLVHFSAVGKPWSYSVEEARRARPRAEPFFLELWSRW